MCLQCYLSANIFSCRKLILPERYGDIMVPFGMKLLPLVTCVAVFAFTTAGFFLTDGGTEKIYEILSLLSFACALVQMAMLL